MFTEAKNSKQQGDIGLGAAIAYFTSKAYTVSVPLTDSQDYDLVVDDGDSLLKVQVKTSGYKAPSGSYEVGLKTAGGNQSWNGVVKYFDPEAVDYLFILCGDGSQYCMEASAIGKNKTVTLGKKWQRFRLGGDPGVGL